jgi:hypothetical protein
MKALLSPVLLRLARSNSFETDPHSLCGRCACDASAIDRSECATEKHVRGVEQDLLAAHRSPPSRSTLERLALRLGTKIRETAVRIERHLRAAEELPDDAFAINLGLDRTTVPMAEDEPMPRKIGSDVKGPPPTRRVLRYRMAYVGLDSNVRR